MEKIYTVKPHQPIPLDSPSSFQMLLNCYHLQDWISSDWVTAPRGGGTHGYGLMSEIDEDKEALQMEGSRIMED